MKHFKIVGKSPEGSLFTYETDAKGIDEALANLEATDTRYIAIRNYALQSKYHSIRYDLTIKETDNEAF